VSLALLLAGCAGETGVMDSADAPTAGGVALVAVDAWVPADSDPYDDERPDTVDCPDWGYGEELGVFEVETDICRYGSFSQPLLAQVAAGDALSLDLWHDALWAAEPAQAHLALGLGDQVLWELTVGIPADAQTYRLSLQAQSDAASGAKGVHVHNHGANSYNFGVLSRD